jgi:YidC/Oxa1 family membrane protein insertase
MNDNRNMLLAIVLSVVILIGFQYAYEIFYPKPEQPVRPPETPGAQMEPPAPAPQTSPGVSLPAADALPPTSPTLPAMVTRGKVLADTPRVRIDTPRVHGSIALVGGRLDDVTLVDYRETVDPTSPEIVLFSPIGSQDAYFAQVGWVGGEPPGGLPDASTVWSADTDVLAPDRPVTLSWTNASGITFRRTFAVDQNYMFTLSQRIENGSGAPVSLSPYALISRQGTPPTSGFMILHEGPLGVFDETLKEIDYSDLQEAGTIQQKSRGGWIGITDKYWLAAAIPGPDEAINSRFLYDNYQGKDRYQVDFVGSPVTVEPGGTAEHAARFFVGAKEVRLLDGYRERYDIARFDRAIDFGWFYFLTKPLFYFLIYIREAVGNTGVAILLLTVLIKLIFFPLANKSYRAMSQMRKLQPEIVKLKERFGEDRTRFNQEMMALYKREKVNPASGCLPIVIQIPVFFALYKVLFVTIEMRHAPFFGWVQDLSAPDPTSVWNVFGLIPWDPSQVLPQMLNIGAWPLIMGVTMWMQQRLNPQPPDPLQAKMMMMLPIIFTFFLAHFPAGLVVYWAWNNALSILQQWVIMRRMGVKA